MSLLRLIRLCLLFATLAASARAQVVLSDFETGLDGWLPYTAGTHDAAVSVSWNATAGVGGSGALVLNDPGTGADDYFVAPAKFLGDKSSCYGGTLSFALELTLSAVSGLPENLLLTGGGLTIAASLSPAPTTGGFTSYSLSLVETSGWHLAGTATAPTQMQMQSILGNLTEFRLLGDWGNGAEAARLDNVRLAAVPEPSTLLLLAAGGALIGLVRRRQSRA